MERPHQLDHRRGWRRQAALDPSGQVLHVGHGHDGRLRLLVEVRAPGQQRVVDHVDGVAVLDLVLGRRQQVGRQPGVGRRIGAAGSRSRHRVRAHDVAGAGDEQLGSGAHEPVGGEEHARRIATTQLGQHGLARDRQVGLDDDLSRQHDLSGRPGPQLVAGGHDRRAPLVGRSGAGDGEPGRVRRAVALGEVEVREPPGGVRRAHRRHPSCAVLGPADEDLGHDQPTLAARVEGERADRHRTGAGQAERVVDLDRVQRVVHRGRRGGGVAGRHLDAKRLAPPGQSDPALGPQHPVRSGHVDRVEVEVEPLGPGPKRGRGLRARLRLAAERAHRLGAPTDDRSRVAVSSWAMPPDKRSRRASVKPAACSWPTSSGGSGR